MIVYFGLDGRLMETVSSYTLRDSGGNEHASFGRRKGSAGANEILAIFEGGAPTKGSLAITYRLPSGELYEPSDLVLDNAYTGYIEFDRTQDLKYLEYEKKYEVIEFDFPKGLFPNGGDGLYLATIRNVEGDAVIRAYGLVTFSVEDSAVKRDSSITESQYDYLVSLIESSPLYVRKAGDTMTGPLNVPAGTTEMGGATEKEITNKAYVDGGLDRKFDKMGGTIGGLVDVRGNMTVSGDVTSSGGSFASPQIVWNSPDKIPNAKDVAEYFVNKKRNNFSAAKETVETLVDFQTAPKSQDEPTASDDLATKGYVDKVAASAGGYNLENGSGENSIQQRGNQATGANSAAFGAGNVASADGQFVVGKHAKASKDGAFVVGGGTDAEGVNLLEITPTRAVFSGDNSGYELSAANVNCLSFHASWGAIDGDLTVSGTLSAHTFSKVEAETLSTKRNTIGLAQGNKAAIPGYIGLYAEKYDGENYGALVWDSTGTAYVGDATVDENGVVSDPNKQLQPILTRDSDASMSASAFGLIYWNAITKRAENSGIQIQNVPDRMGDNYWTGWQNFSGGFGIGYKGDESPVLWFNQDSNGKLLMKANGQTVQFQDAKGGVVAYLSDLDDKASKSEFENLVKVTATDVGKDSNGYAVLCHDGTEITGQKKSVKLADVLDNGAVIGRDQTSGEVKTTELITKAYGDKSYVQIDKDNRFSTGGIEFMLGTKLKAEEIYGGVLGGDGFVTIYPSGDKNDEGVTFVSAGTSVLTGPNEYGTLPFTGTYFGAELFGGGDLSSMNPEWKSVYGMVSAYQSQAKLVQGGFEALGFVNSKTALERLSTPNPSYLTFFSTHGQVKWFDMTGNAQYDYQLPKKSGTIALTSDLSEAGTSVTIRRW